MKASILVFALTLFAGIAFSQPKERNSKQIDNESPCFLFIIPNGFSRISEPKYDKSFNSKVRFYGSNNGVRENNRNKYFRPYEMGVINQSLLLKNFRVRTSTGKC